MTLKSKSIHSRSSKKLFSSYRKTVVIEDFFSLVVDLWAKNCVIESAWTLTSFLSTFFHSKWNSIESGQRNITKYKEYTQTYLNFCNQLKPKNLLKPIVP